MKNRISLFLMGALILQGATMGMPAMADHHRDSARRHYVRSVENANEAACQRAEARAHARAGHSIRSKVKSLQARISEKRAIENRREANEHRYHHHHDD